MTHIGMTYDDWRAQFGNTLGLTHDSVAHRYMVANIRRPAREGMVGFYCGAAENHPAKSSVNPTVNSVNRPLASTLELFSLYYGDKEDVETYMPDPDEGGPPSIARRVQPRDRSTSLRWYYRNREKVREYNRLRAMRSK
jgi:hypothetical protein